MYLIPEEKEHVCETERKNGLIEAHSNTLLLFW